MDYVKLGFEIKNDPAGLGYLNKTNQQVADLLNAATVLVDRETVAAYDVFEAIVLAEYNLLTSACKTLLGQVLGMGSLNVRGTNARTALLSIFATAGSTKQNLAALQKQTMKRTDYLGLGEVMAGHVGKARVAVGIASKG